MNSPLYVSSCVRKGGVTFLTVMGNELTVADEGKTLKVIGISDKTADGTFTISKIIPPDTIQYLQPNQLDIPNGLIGGAVAIGDTIVPAPPPVAHHHKQVTEQVANKEGDVTWEESWKKRRKKK